MAFLFIIAILAFAAVAVATTLLVVGIVKKHKGFLVAGIGLYLLYILGYFALQFFVTSM